MAAIYICGPLNQGAATASSCECGAAASWRQEAFWVRVETGDEIDELCARIAVSWATSSRDIVRAVSHALARPPRRGQSSASSSAAGAGRPDDDGHHHLGAAINEMKIKMMSKWAAAARIGNVRETQRGAVM